MKKVLVGRNGFLAQAVRRVAESGELTVLGSNDFDLINGSTKVLEALRGKDLLIDTADYYPGIVATSENPVEVYETNVKMYENLFALAQQNGIKKIVTIGTTGCYPITDEQLHEDMFDGDISKLNKKLASYALSRFTLLDIAGLYRNQFGIEHSHLILPNFYGPGDKYEVGRSHLLASWVRDFHAAKERGETSIELWGPPTQRREFIYIDDAAKYTLSLGQADIGQEVINVGTNTSPTYEEMATSILRALDFECELTWDLSKQMPRQQEVMDTSAMRALAVDLPVPLPFDEGVKETVRDYLNGTKNA